MARARPASRGGEAGDDEPALTPVTPVSTKVARPMPVCSSRPLGDGESDAGEPGDGVPGRDRPFSVIATDWFRRSRPTDFSAIPPQVNPAFKYPNLLYRSGG